MKKYLLLTLIIISFAPAYSQHAPGYVDSTIENQTWNGAEWVHGYTTYFYYHAPDTLYYTSITKAWDTVTMAYDLSQSQDIVNYTNSQKIQQDEQQTWVTSQAIWRNLNQSLYTYDARNNLTNLTTQLWDTTLSTWVNSTQTMNKYDNNNNDTLSVLQNWNTSTNTWRNFTLQANTFDGSRRVVQGVHQSWDTINNVWANVRKDIMQYTNADTTYQFSQSWDNINNVWVNNIKDIDLLDPAGNTIFIFAYEWNTATATYDSSFDYRYAYNTYNELLSSEYREVRIHPVYGPFETPSYNTYDSAGNIIESLLQFDEFLKMGSWDLFSTLNLNRTLFTWKLTTFPLPVTLLNFIGKAVANTTQLQWNTVMEINSSYFEVQRSADGNNFKPIGKVAAVDDGNLTQTYSFTDNAPRLNATNFYRLKEVDRDGHFVYSKIITSSFNEKVLVKIYPNPATDNVLIDINAVPSGNYHINLTDAGGKVVLSKAIYISAGEQQISLSISSYATGLYFFEIRDILNHVITNQKIVKQ